jgi:hypothetical protein
MSSSESSFSSMSSSVKSIILGGLRIFGGGRCCCTLGVGFDEADSVRPSDHPRTTQTLEFPIKDLPKAKSEVELRTEVMGKAEAHTHRGPCSACTMAMKMTTVPKTALSTTTPSRKCIKTPLNLRHNYNPGKSTILCNGLHITINIPHPTLCIIQHKHTKIPRPKV